MRVAFLAVLAFIAAVSGQAADRRVRGVVTDESGGVLPGATVVVTAADGREIANAVTDAAGRYAVGPLAPGPVSVTVHLEGFAIATERAEVRAGEDAVVSPRLHLAPKSETVEVSATIPKPPPPIPLPPPVPPRPRPVTVAVPEHDRDSVCGPAKLERTQSFGEIRSRRQAVNGIYAQGDELEIAGGTATGLTTGGNFVVRRTFRTAWDPRELTGEHTAGLVQIVRADAQSAVAVVIYACDEMLPGDRLVPLGDPPPPLTIEPRGRPDYGYAAKILFPDIGPLLGATTRMMVIDRGVSSGVRPGQHVTLFRRRAGSSTPVIVGDAVVVAVRRDSATIRIGQISGAVFEGDWAALER